MLKLRMSGSQWLSQQRTSSDMEAYLVMVALSVGAVLVLVLVGLFVLSATNDD